MEIKTKGKDGPFSRGAGSGSSTSHGVSNSGFHEIPRVGYIIDESPGSLLSCAVRKIVVSMMISSNERKERQQGGKS